MSEPFPFFPFPAEAGLPLRRPAANKKGPARLFIKGSGFSQHIVE